MTLEQAIQVAVGHHQAGRFSQAEDIYRGLLVHHPGHPEILQLLGALAGQTNRVPEAIDLISRAIRIEPANPVYHCNLSEMCRRAGRLTEAIEHGRQAVRLKPDYAKAYCNLGAALRDAGQSDEAIAAFRRAVAMNPQFIEAISNLGHALRARQQFPEAIAAFRRVCALDPRSAEAFVNLGISLRENGNYDEAFAALHRAIELNPRTALAYNNLGVAYSESIQLDKAMAAFARAIELQPDYALAHKNRAVAFAELCQYPQAVASFDRAIELQPDLPEAHALRALMYLVQGDFERGWPEYEWRFKAQLREVAPLRNFPKPQWTGGDIEGKTLLIHSEQGFGDTIQFIRYAPLVAMLGARIVFECQAPLVRLLRNVEGIGQILPAGESLPGFDFHCPLLSLPLAFGTRMETIPADIPYISPDPTLVAKWKERVESAGPGLKVGLVWSGNPKHKLTRHRAMQLAQLEPLARVAGVRFFSLQKGDAARQPPAPGLSFVDCGPELQDFAETAGLIANLDLVISVDTAVAHLAGAMGKRVWIFIPFSPDWRWLLEREDSPWYPTARLFRQKALGKWNPVVDSIVGALEELTRVVV